MVIKVTIFQDQRISRENKYFTVESNSIEEVNHIMVQKGFSEKDWGFEYVANPISLYEFYNQVEAIPKYSVK